MLAQVRHLRLRQVIRTASGYDSFGTDVDFWMIQKHYGGGPADKSAAAPRIHETLCVTPANPSA